MFFIESKNNATFVDENLVDFQKLAQSAGFAYFNPICHLCILPHAIGPWFAFRAAIIFDMDYLNLATITQPNPYPEGDELISAITQNGILNWTWMDWYKLRQVAGQFCPQESRYSEEQVRWHYIQDRECLEKAIEKHRRALSQTIISLSPQG